ncbi:MAG: phosphopantetheine-binding protein [Candidatus Saganbacteria bacterium]|nr:phosphopantetheine-binding protein [Candidatus Saganbacteria bacterium]
MEYHEILQKLKEMLITQLNLNIRPEDINERTQLFNMAQESRPQNRPPDSDSLGLDSIDSLEIIVGIDKNFGVKITNEDLKSPEAIFKDIGTMANFIKSKMK